MKIDFEPDPGTRDINFLDEQLLRFNAERIHGYAYKDFLLKAHSPSGEWVAGLHGQVGGGWLYIAALWVGSGHRGQGIGRHLVCTAEETALKKGCKGAYLYTYSFQNPGFYKTLGYATFGTLEDFCGNNAKHYMKKRFTHE